MIIPTGKPRIGENADKIGAYDQCIKVITPVINPGEWIYLEQYFTGYGLISTPKIAFYPSTAVFDPKHSYVVSGVRWLPVEGGKPNEAELRFGGQTERFTKNVGLIVSLSAGITNKGWNEFTQFFDISANTKAPILLTEINIEGEAPLTYNLKSLKSIKPGPYYVEIVFTYFNGNNWVTSKKEVEFKVQNILERYAVAFGILALLATCATLVDLYLTITQ